MSCIQETSDPRLVELEASPSIVTLLRLYISHFLSTWGDRLYEFAVYLFIQAAFPTTLLPVSAYGFVTTAFAALLSPSVGHYVDKISRFSVVRTSILAQKASIIISCICYWGLLAFFNTGSSYSTEKNNSMDPRLALFCAIVFLGAVLKLATVGLTISVEKDWVVVIANNDSMLLTKLNTMMRRIDLFCKLVAPLLIGFLISFTSVLFGVAFVGFWNVISLVLELYLIFQVYIAVPELKRPKNLHQPEQVPSDSTILESTETIQSNSARQNSLYWVHMFKESVKSWRKNWEMYVRHPVFLASLSYSFTYLTVLSFGGSMVGYLKYRGYSDGFISGMRGVNVVAGLIATALMPWIKMKIGLVRTGIWAIISEVLCLIPVVVSFYVWPGVLEAILLFGGMALSRIGLWSFDLTATQLLQEQVSIQQAGLINGHQYVLVNLFDLGQYLLTMVWNEPPQFATPAIISCASVAMSAVFYGRYTYLNRGHLLHYEKLAAVCCDHKQYQENEMHAEGI
ncbi:uncharacterized protein VTP21DRAFT_8860 [Calcarisporiella thermophila]|uniref:uncharacterized protein n=1 Tax=Calcarisporiella thermophila TaxID=911321 RepID=UPI003742CA96